MPTRGFEASRTRLEHLDRTREHCLHGTGKSSSTGNLGDRKTVRVRRDEPTSGRVGSKEERVDGGDADQGRRDTWRTRSISACYVIWGLWIWPSPL